MIFEVAHQMSLLPVFVLLGLVLSGRAPERAHILFAAALATSWVGDSIMLANGGSFDFVYLWAPVQITLAYASVLRPRESKTHIIHILVALNVALFSHNMRPENGFLLYIAGGIGLMFCALGCSLFWPITIYFGAGSVVYYFMIDYFGDPQFMVTWYLYQSCRAASILLFCGILIRTQRSTHALVAR